MRASVPRLVCLSLCAALLAACAGSVGDSPQAMKATFDAGLRAYDAGDYAAAFRKWQSIDDVDLAAMRNVAVMLRTGKGVGKDPRAAEAMMARAASAGLATAQADLGDMLLKGEAGPPDPKAAVPWLELATSAGHPIAAFELGQLSEHGIGVKRDLRKARLLYAFAAQAGVPGAAQSLAALPPETGALTP